MSWFRQVNYDHFFMSFLYHFFINFLFHHSTSSLLRIKLQNLFRFNFCGFIFVLLLGLQIYQVKLESIQYGIVLILKKKCLT